MAGPKYLGAGASTVGAPCGGPALSRGRAPGLVSSSVTLWLFAVSPGQLKEVVKVLEKLNGSGRWKWLLHYKESKKLQKDVR